MALLQYNRGFGFNRGPAVNHQVKSGASIIAILCAIGSFIVANAAGKMVLAMAAVLFGLIGMMRAVSPRVSGGILSMIAIALACIGFVVAIIDAIF